MISRDPPVSESLRQVNACWLGALEEDRAKDTEEGSGLRSDGGAAVH